MKKVARVVSTGFWEDPKVMTAFTPEDKYFMLYLLTNPHTTQLGIYPLVPKIAAFEMGYSTEAVISLIDRFENKYGVIKYNKETMEVAIKNFLKYSVLKGGKPVMDCLLQDKTKVKDKTLLTFVAESLSESGDLVSTVKDFLGVIKEDNNKDNDKDNNNNDDNENDNDNDNDNERIVSCDFLRNLAKRDDSEEIETTFEALWKMYPRKLGKGSIRNATKKRIYAIGFETMKKCIDRYREAIAGKDEQFVMYGSTFFNSGYIDYLDENFCQEEAKYEVLEEPEEPEAINLWEVDDETFERLMKEKNAL